MHIFETRHRVGHSAEEMFALVAAVEDYPQFLPLCEALEVKGREFAGGKEMLIATMTVGYRLIRESFTTEVILDKASRTIFVILSRWSVRASRKSLALRVRERRDIRDRFLHRL